MKKQLLLLLFLLVQVSLFAQDVLKDIYPGSSGNGHMFVTPFGAGTSVLFFATDGIHGTELWKSDGTPSGTVLVKDINPGVAGCSPTYITVINNVAYFTANNGVNGSELWKTNGTQAGTVLVKDIWPGANGSSASSMQNINGILYFSANNGTHGYELWKSNGTASGTILVRDISSGSTGSNPQYITNVNGVAYFTSMTAANGTELWKSNGTTSGTVLVKDIWSGTSGSSPHSLINVNGILYFNALTSTNGRELWKSNGTASGTVLVKDLWTGTQYGNPDSFTNVNGVLFFRAASGTNGYELWKTNGTASGTVMVKDIRSGTASSNPSNFTRVGNKLFFWADNGTVGNELWTSDGTFTGTLLVKDLTPGATGSFIDGVVTDGYLLYFFCNHTLWNSDGSTARTIALTKSYAPMPYMTSIKELKSAGGMLYYKTNEPGYGVELSTYDSRYDVFNVVTDLSKTPQLTLCKGQYVDINFRPYVSVPGSVDISITPIGASVFPSPSFVRSPKANYYGLGTLAGKAYFSSTDSVWVRELKFTFTDPVTGAVLKEKYVPVNIMFRGIAQESSLQAALIYYEVPAISFPHIYLRNNSDSATTLSWQYIQINLGNNIVEPMVQEAEFVPPMYYPSRSLKLLKDIKLQPHQTVHLSVGAILPMDPSKPLSIIEAGWINGQNTTFILIPNSPVVHLREASISDELLTETPAAVTPNVLSVYPNPAQTSATFQVQLKEDSHVLLRIADMQGNTVTTITNTQMEEGTHAFDWNVPGGQQMYIYQLFVNGALTDSGKVIVQ